MGPGQSRVGGGDSTIERRIPLIALVIILVFGVFYARLFQLQLVQSDDFRQRSERNYVRTVRLEAPRGEILDREGRVLATTRTAFGLQVVPNDLQQPDLVFASLAILLDDQAELLQAEVGTPRGRLRFKPIRLAGDLSYDQLARVESHLYALGGVFTDRRPRRYYAAGSLGAHVLGYLGEIQKRQLETRVFADYRAGEVIGQAGIESVLQPRLRGRAGGRNLVVDVAGRVVGSLDEIEPIKGGDVTLTLDRELQDAAEKAFLPDVLGGREKMGAVVAIDVRTGDVLALVSKPDFDPNAFAGGIDAKSWKALTTDEWRPLQNRAISGQYPPGSTYKAFIAAAGLEEGLAQRRRTFCPGKFRLGRRSYGCWKKAGHGWVDLRRALKESCDVFFYELGLELGVDKLAYFARGFGLGSRSGINIPNESIGLVPTSAWKERRFSEPWMKGETVSTSIGQGFNLVTPLQLAVAYAAIANGGQVVRPRLVLRSKDVDGNEVEGPAPEVVESVPVDPEHLARIREALEAVVQEPRGTGGRSRVKGVRVAGKTGTAQVVSLKHTENLEEDEIQIRHRDHAWFAAFAPAEAPEIAVAALVEHGGHGGAAAAPIVQKVLAAYFAEDEPEPEEPEIDLPPELELELPPAEGPAVRAASAGAAPAPPAPRARVARTSEALDVRN
jgi:penicillin-binding protein 2